MISRRWDVVAVPFPFSDRPGHKRRPALVLTNSSFNRAGHTVLCMITSSGRADWPGDVELKNLKSAGLAVRCLVRFKLFTLDNQLILRSIGRLGAADLRSVANNLKAFLAG